MTMCKTPVMRRALWNRPGKQERGRAALAAVVLLANGLSAGLAFGSLFVFPPGP